MLLSHTDLLRMPRVASPLAQVFVLRLTRTHLAAAVAVCVGSVVLGGCNSSPTAATESTETTTTDTGVPTVTAILPTNGLNDGGTSVSITGTNFTNASAVVFGSENAASYTVNSAASITAKSPPSTGSPDSTSTVDVTVTNDQGTSATVAADRFSYTHNVLTRLSVLDASVHGGTPLVGTVAVLYPAPASGYTLPLTWSSGPPNSTAASIPSTVSIAPGFTTGSFVISTSPVSSQQCFLIVLTLYQTASAAFCIIP